MGHFLSDDKPSRLLNQTLKPLISSPRTLNLKVKVRCQMLTDHKSRELTRNRIQANSTGSLVFRQFLTLDCQTKKNYWASSSELLNLNNQRIFKMKFGIED